MKLPTINNRELLPIRLIPVSLGFNLSPLDLAKLLAHKVGLAWPALRPEDELFAFHLDNEDFPAKMLPHEWGNFVSDIEVVARKFKLQETFEDENYRPWRLEALKLLPARVFVWRDEFESVFQASFNRNGLTYSENANVGTKELNFYPFIEPQYLPVVWEGFETFFQSKETAKPIEGISEQTLYIKQIKELSATKGLQRANLLRLEIIAAFEELGEDPTPQKVMKKLKEYAGKEGSCIVEALPRSVRWKDDAGDKKELDMKALRGRLTRLRKVL